MLNGTKKAGEPIGKPDGSRNGYFTGSFEGAYHIISGLWINRTDSDNIGLFGGVNSYNNDTCI